MRTLIYFSIIIICIALVFAYYKLRSFNAGLANTCAILFTGLTIMWIAAPGWIAGVITFSAVIAGFVYYVLMSIYHIEQCDDDLDIDWENGV